MDKVKCPCGGATTKILTDMQYQLDSRVITIYNIPALECSVCDEIYFWPQTCSRIEKLAHDAIAHDKDSIDYGGFDDENNHRGRAPEIES